MKMIRFLMIAVVVLGLAVPALAQDNVPRGNWQADTTWTPRPYAPLSDLYDEDFADIFLLEVPPPAGPGWSFINNSSSIGLTSWFQGNTGVFPAQAGDATSYLGGNFNAVGDEAGPDTINLWGVTGEFDLTNVAEISFWTRTVDGSSWPDRLELRVAENGGSSDNVGSGPNDVGDFTTLLVEVDPNLVGDYPQEWTKFTASGPWAGTGRFALRYWVTDAGPIGTNSNYIGIDTLQVSSTGGGDGGGDDGGGPVPATTTWGVIVLIALFLGITLFYLRKRSTAGA